MYIYHALVNVLSVHRIHTSLDTIFYTHTERRHTETIYVRYYMESHTHARTHAHTHTHTHTRARARAEREKEKHETQKRIKTNNSVR